MEQVKVHCGLGLDKPIDRINYLCGYAEAQGYVCLDHALMTAIRDEIVHLNTRWSACLAHIDRLEKKNKKGTK